MDGEFLEITDGVLEGLALETWGFVAELEGRLDCNDVGVEANASSGVYGWACRWRSRWARSAAR